jgi:DNA-binding CsgD family transcriptional regulator
LTALKPQQDHARLVHHAEAAGDDNAVFEHARAAGEYAAAVGAHREAAAQYARALRFAGAHGNGEVAELLERRSYECYLTDQVEEGLEARRAALAYYQSVGDRIREGDQQRWISRLSWFAGRNDEAESAAEEAIALLEPTGATRELAMAFSNFAQLRMLADDRDAAVKWGERAISLAQQLGDRETLAHALNNVGSVEARRGLGTSRLEASLAIALDDQLEEHVARAYTNLGSLAVQQYDHAAATRFLDEGITYCNERDLDSWRLYMLGWQAQLRLRVGRWDEAAADAQIVVLDPSTAPPTRITALVVLGQLRARRGDPQPLELLDEALELAQPIGELQRLGPVVVARAEAAFLLGRNDDVVAEARRLSLPELTDRWVAGELAIFLHRVGADVRDVGELPEPFVLELGDDHDAAAAAWRKLGCPYHAALAAAWGDSEEALKESHRELTRLGAATTADLVARRARERGWRGLSRGPRQATRATPASLTAREVDVLRLVADGLRNNEIAQQLFLSTRTVDHHVSAILRKLEVRTRGQATAAAARLGLLEGNGDAKLGNSADAPDAPRL